jgi:hypothetical protein
MKCQWLWEKLAITQHHDTLHHSRKWLLTLSPYIQVGKLRVHITNNTTYIGCNCGTCYFAYMKSVTFHNLIIETTRWSNTKKTCVQLYVVSSSTCWWPNWPIFGDYSYWIMLYVMWAIYKGCHDVELWLMLQRLAYGMFYTTIKGSTGWKMVLPLVH